MHRRRRIVPDARVPLVDRIQPVVLVGGRSRRFGRDKLREPLPDGALVERPIRALQDVFGPRVALVGHCDASVGCHGDLVIPDRYPGAGPAGGILSALEHLREHAPSVDGVFVLAGDLPRVQRTLVQSIVDASRGHPGAAAVLASTNGRLEACIGIYRTSTMEHLRGLVAPEAAHGRSLVRMLKSLTVVEVPADPALTVNVNRPTDLTD